MSADDQQFLDVLSSLPNQVQRYSGEVADYVDKTIEKAAESVRDSLASATWLPDAVRNQVRIPSRARSAQVVPLSVYERAQDWVARHKILTGVMVVAVGYVSYKSVKESKMMRKTRRAKRARNGSRLEVVIVAGSPTLPLTRSLSLDLERRGFIVYVVCGSIEDEVVVHNLARPDVKPLTLDITDPPKAGASIERFASYLQTPHSAVPRAKANYLTLKSVILIPSLNYQTSPIATIPPDSFADLFNTHLLHPILTIQAFLPLLTSKVTPQEEAPTATPKVIVFTPSIISSINPPFHAPEATVCSALSAFTEVLTGELRPLAIPVTHIQLGSFDFSNFVPARQATHHSSLLPPAETLSWPEHARHAYGRNYVAQSTSAISNGRVRGMRRSSLRELNHAVFDVIDGSEQSRVVRVGLGASIYGFVGQWCPRGLVSWMMGVRRVGELSAWGDGSYAGSSSEPSSSENGEVGEYIAVGRDQDGGANVWKET